MPTTQQPRQKAQRFSGQHDVDETLSKLGIRQETRRDLYQGHNAGAQAMPVSLLPGCMLVCCLVLTVPRMQGWPLPSSQSPASSQVS